MSSWRDDPELTEAIIKESLSVNRCWLCQYLHVVYDFTNGPYMFWCDKLSERTKPNAEGVYEDNTHPAQKACYLFEKNTQHFDRWGPLHIEALKEYDESKNQACRM